MECLELRERISAWIDGEASGEEAARVEAHLASCASCRVSADRMRLLSPALDRVRTAPPATLRRDLFARLEADGLLAPRRKRFGVPLRWAAVPLAAAAGLALFVLSSREAADLSPAHRGPAAQVASKEPQVPSSRERAREEPAAPSPEEGASRPSPAPVRSLPPEDREIVAYLDVLEQPSTFEDGAPAFDDMLVPYGPERG